MSAPNLHLAVDASTSLGGRVSWWNLVERAAGLVLLVSFAPLVSFFALVLMVLSRRSPLVAHLRVGQNQMPFWMLKLRTMWSHEPVAAAEIGWIQRIVAEPDGDRKDPGDVRVSSRFAAFCRRHSLDEFPQLWHVLRGEMSLVGPRPLTRGEMSRYYGVYAEELLSRKPGLTGLWQINGRSCIVFPERAALDLKLVRTLTPGMYVKILLRTVPAIFHGRGAW